MQRNHHSRNAWVRRLARSALCLALVPQTAAALPLLSEVFYDASGSDNGQSFVEIVGVPGSLLDGYTVEAVNGSNGAITHSLTLLGAIPADGIFVLADDVGDGTSLVAGADQVSNFDFQNGPDSVLLRDATGVVDAVGYGVFGVGDVFVGEGAPAADAAAGSSLARRFADLDTDDNANDWVVLAQPTPGSAQLQPVPEPSLSALFAAGLVVLAGSARRGCRPR